MAKFNTAAQAREVGAALFASGKVHGWCEYPCFGKFTVRILVHGRWFNLTAAELAA